MEQKEHILEEEEIDLLEIAHLLWRKLYIIIICFIVGALAAGSYTMFMVTPQYTATSMIYILGETTSITSVHFTPFGGRKCVLGRPLCGA